MAGLVKLILVVLFCRQSNALLYACLLAMRWRERCYIKCTV